MAKNITKGKIGNALTSTANDHVVAVANDIYDETLDKYQNELNDDMTRAAIVDTWEGEDDDPEIPAFDPTFSDGAGYAHNWKTTDTPASDGKSQGNLKDLYNKTLESEEKITELSSRTDGISKEVIETEEDSIIIEDNNGNEVFHLDENGLDAKNVKSNGKDVLTEHQDISGLATKEEVTGVQKEVNGIQERFEGDANLDDCDTIDFVNKDEVVVTSIKEDGLESIGYKSKTKKRFSEEVCKTVDEIKNVMTEPCISFLLSTDLHYGNSPILPYLFDDTIRNQKKVSESIRFDYNICLGDFTEGEVSKSETKRMNLHLMEGFKSVGIPMMFCIGNHDDNRYPSGAGDLFSASEIYSEYISYCSVNNPFAMNGTDYYRDNETLRYRLIFINSNNFFGGYEFTTETLTFLQNSILSLPEGYKFMVFTHTPPLSKMNYDNRTRPNGDAVKNILLQHIDKMVVMFYGHSHQDNVWANPFWAICTCCEKFDNENGEEEKWSEDAEMPHREQGDHTEDLWDAVVVKKDTIDMIRFGAGGNRTIHVSPIELSTGEEYLLTAKLKNTTWSVRDSESTMIAVNNGKVRVLGGTAGQRLQVTAKDAFNNKEYWVIKIK